MCSFWENLPKRMDTFFPDLLALPLTFHMVHHSTLHLQWF